MYALQLVPLIQAFIAANGEMCFNRTNVVSDIEQSRVQKTCIEVETTDSHPSWQEAEDHCRIQFSGHLVSIHSRTEVEIIHKYTNEQLGEHHVYRGRCWIGLFDPMCTRDPEASTNNNDWYWRWSDGSSVDYVRWALNEPNNPGTECCGNAYLKSLDEDKHTKHHDTKWNDYRCNATDTGCFVCQYYPLKEPIISSTSACWKSVGLGYKIFSILIIICGLITLLCFGAGFLRIQVVLERVDSTQTNIRRLIDVLKSNRYTTNTKNGSLIKEIEVDESQDDLGE